MLRLNAKERPSGEKAGSKSPKDCFEGEVSLCFSPVSTDSRDSAKGPISESFSLMASQLPSGDQAGRLEVKVSAILRSRPPIAGISSTAVFPEGKSRRNATNRPSGDHAG